MQIPSTHQESIKRKISTLYRIALGCYVIPFLFLGLLLIPYIFKTTEMLFWILFLISLLPLALTGLLFSYFGLKLAKQHKLSSKQNAGYNYILFLGIPLIIIGIFGWALVLVVTW